MVNPVSGSLTVLRTLSIFSFIAESMAHNMASLCGCQDDAVIAMILKRMQIIQAESTTTRTAGGLAFTAIGGKSQGREVPQSLRVEPGASHPVWKTQKVFLDQKGP